MLRKIFNNYLSLVKVYFYPIIFAIGFLISLSYSFSAIDAYHIGGIVYRGILSAILLLVSVPVIVTNFNRIYKIIIIFSCIFFTCNLLAIFIAPTITKTNIDILNSLLGIASSSLIVLSVLLYCSLNKTDIDEKVFKITTLCFIGLVILLCLYTYVFEYKDIYNSIFNEQGWNYDVTSIFRIKTEYGNYLLIGSFLSFIYFYRYRNKLMFVVSIFFFINMLLSRSKTSLVISIPLLLLFIVFLIKDGLLMHRKVTIIICSSCLLFILAFALLCISKVGIFGSINYFLRQTIFNDGVVVIKDRFKNWSNALLKLNNFFVIIFGYGERVGPMLVSGAGDNYYMYSLLSGGLIRIILYFGLISYWIFSIVKDDNISKLGKTLVILLQSLILITGLTDTIGIVGFTYTSTFFGFLFFRIENLFKKDHIQVE